MTNLSRIVVTNCTQRKRSPGGVVCARNILTESLGSTSLSESANFWLKSVSAAADKLPIEQTYGGRSFSEARWVTDHLGADLYVVSAGLGLLPPESLIPNYNLTVSGGVGSIKKLLARLEVGPGDWWSALTTAAGTPNPVHGLAMSSSVHQIFLALPSAYLHLLRHDLEKIPEKNARKLRILTSPLGARAVPENLNGCVLPYDDRLEGIYPGTRADFPQRALRHFVTAFPPDLTNEEAQERVANAMAASTKPTIPDRERKTDTEIITLLGSEWNRFNGSSTRLLRFLRDEALVACEQSRFRDLWRKVAAIKN